MRPVGVGPRYAAAFGARGARGALSPAGNVRTRWIRLAATVTAVESVGAAVVVVVVDDVAFGATVATFVSLPCEQAPAKTARTAKSTTPVLRIGTIVPNSARQRVPRWNTRPV